MVKALAQVCIGKTNVSLAAVQEVRENKLDNAAPETKCFLNCFVEGLGFMADGKRQDNNIRKTLNPIYGRIKIFFTLLKCRNYEGANNCESGFNMYKCFLENGALP